MSGDFLRPNSFDEYIGQQQVIREIDIRIRAARANKVPMDHVLLVGPPGSGKTSLACVIGVELGEDTELLTCPVNVKTLARVVRSFSGILVLDELHALSKAQLESLLSLLEFGYLGLPSGERVVAEWLTVIGTTTERQKIIPPLWDRFPSKPSFTPYTEDDLAYIVAGMAIKQGVDLSDEGMRTFARAALGVPRVARQLVVAYHSMVSAAQASDEPMPVPADALTLLQTEADGLTRDHLLYLTTLDLLGGTKGLAVISSLMNLHEGVIRELERVLIERGFILLGEAGRQLTSAGYARIRAHATSPRVAS